MKLRAARAFLTFAIGCAAIQAAAEVKVILKDGREFALPLNKGEVDRIEVDGDRWRPESREEKVQRVIGGDGSRPEPAPRPPAAAAPAPPAQAAGGRRVLKVGPTRNLQTPGVAAKEARDGDVIEIDPVEYFGDVAIWRANNLTIRGAGGRPVLDAGGQAAEGKGIWVTKGSNIAIEDVVFQNARVRDRNGAGIRAEGANLTIRRCLFKANENGILAANADGSTITVENSEFADGGHGDGQSHGIYVNKVDRFIFRFNYVHGTKIGHHVKTRAVRNEISYNLLYDGENGTSSYAIDLNDPVSSLIVGNVIQQSKFTDNSSQIQIGAKFAPEGAALWIVNNTVISDRHQGIFLLNNSPIEAQIRNNLLVGPMEMAKGRAEASDNVIGDYGFFVDAKKLDFRLRRGAAAVDAGRAVQAGEHGVMPEFEYAHPAGKRPRKNKGRPDAGAFELSG